MYANMHHRSSSSSSATSHHHHHGVMDPRADGSAQWVMDLSSGGTALPPSFFDAYNEASEVTFPVAHPVESALYWANQLRENLPEGTQHPTAHDNPVIQDVFWSQSEEEYRQALEMVPVGPIANPLMALIEDRFLESLEDNDRAYRGSTFWSNDPSAAQGPFMPFHQSEGTIFEPVGPEVISQRGVFDLTGENFTTQPAGPQEIVSSNGAFDLASEDVAEPAGPNQTVPPNAPFNLADEHGTSELAGLQEVIFSQGMSDLADGHDTSEPTEPQETVCPQGISDIAVENASPEEDAPFEEETPQEIDLEAATFQDTLDLASRGFEGGLRFRSAEEARRGMERRGEVAFDATLPTTDEQKRVLVALLFRAMQDTSSEGESKAVQDFRRGKWSPESMELVCWEVLENMILRHENGASFTTEHTRKPTGAFWARFDDMRAALKGSKAICKHLLDAPYIYTVVDDPAAALRRVMANKRVNDRKQSIISVGTKAMAQAEGGSPAQLPTPESTTGGGVGTKRPAPGPSKGRPPKKPKG